MPNSVFTVGEDAFSGCNSLSQIVIPLGTRIEIEKLLPTYKEILMEQDELEDLRSNVTYEDLANGVEDEEGVIYSNDGKRLLECTNNRIRNYEIQKGTKMICEGAFYGRKSLESITIPDSVTSIVDNPFRGSRISQISCQSLHYETDGKALYNKSKTHLIAFFSTDIVFHIPTSVVSVGVDAFCESEFLQSINLPDSVASIGDGAFAHCNSLQSIRIPDGVPCIGNGVFGMCYSLKFVHIPNSVTSIGKMAFLECVSLPSIHLPASVTSIGDGAFYECQSLQSIHIPDGITYIGKGAFFKCDSLQSIFIPQGTRTKFEKLIPDYVDKLVEL